MNFHDSVILGLQLKTIKRKNVMSIKLQELYVKNFRSVKSESFKLSDFTALIGYNNGGKSNILDAVFWLLRRYSLREIDFNHPGEPVIIEGTITGITKDFLDKLNKSHRNSIEPFVIGEKLEIQRIQGSPGDSSTKIQLNIKVVNEEGFSEWKPNPAGIDNAIKYLFPEPIQIKAMEDAMKDVSSTSGSSTIGKLINEIIEPIQKKYGSKVEKAMEEVKKIFDADGENRAPELNKFDKQANQKLETLFPSVAIKLHIPTPELKDVFKSGTLKVYEEGKKEGIDISSLGTGAQRSIQMALIRQLAEVKRGEEEELTRTLLLIDEPELYLHPQAIEQVRVALKELAHEGYQVLFSTHSPIMVTAEDVSSAILVRKTPDRGTHCRKRVEDAINDLIKDVPKQLELMFNIGNSSQILFSEKVLLTEGKTEHKVLPKIFEVISGDTLGIHKCALIRQGGVGNTVKSMAVLRAMDIPTKAIVDLDFAFVAAIQNKVFTSNDPDLEVCREIFKKYEKNGRLKLINGLPTNKGKSNDMLSVSKAYEEMANEPAAKEAIESLHNRLKAQNIWLWKKGAIEVHCGLHGKEESHWSRLVNDLIHNEYRNILPEWEEVEKLVQWIKE
jgi:predicted ATP-dependent endonuclease of OLD family